MSPNYTQMKSRNFYFTVIFFSILFFFTNCNQIRKTEIETIFETEKCILGEWKNDDSNKEDAVEYIFTGDVKGDRVENKKFKIIGYKKDGTKAEIEGRGWDVKGVKKIRADLGYASGISIEMINCNRFVARGRNVYVRK